MKSVLFIADPEVRINQQIAVGLSKALQQHGPWQLTLRPLTIKPRGLQRVLAETKPDALVTHAVVGDSKNLKVLHDLALPWVAVAVDHHPTLPIPVVIPDDEAIGRLAAEHLLSLRFQHFAVVGFRGTIASRRFTIFRNHITQNQKTLASYELPSPQLESQDHPGCIRGSQARLVRWLQQLPKPVAIFAHSDQPGAHLIRVCAEHGIPVPDAVAVLGVDDDVLFCHTVYPNLASVHVPNARLGTAAARLILEWKPGRRIVKIPPPAVSSRESVRAPQLTDPLVEKALEFVRAHVGDGVRVCDLQKLTGLTPPMLVYRFRQASRTTPIEEILRHRIILARQLLSETDHAVATIARQCGFRSANQFYVTFRSQVRMSPLDYRAQFAP